MGAISDQELQAWLQPGGDSNSGPVLAPQRLFEFNSNNDSFPSHSNLLSDRVYICSCLILMVSWWVPYLPKGSLRAAPEAAHRLPKGCKPDFNNVLGGDSNSGPILPPSVYLSPTWIMAPDSNNGPSLGHSNLVSDEVHISVQVSYLRFLVVTMTSIRK